MGIRKPLLGKVALVTGGTRGIGRAIALELAEQGADLAINYFRNRAAAEQTQTDIEEFGSRAMKIRAHLGEVEQIRTMFQEINENYGRLDILVNNAASGIQRPIMELEPKHWDWAIAINSRAPWLCAQEAAHLMHNGGHIINISSLGSQRVLPYYFTVGVSKAALEAMTRYLAVEFAPKGINVNGIAGGYVETGALRHFPNTESMTESAKNNTLNGKVLEAKHIAKVTSFLCSEEASMIRGQILVVDGGVSLIT